MSKTVRQKLHLKFNVLTQTACKAIITKGNTCERKTLLQFAKKGEVFVGDRYYGLHYAYLGHTTLKPTMVYLHLTAVSKEQARAALRTLAGS
jgi:hypothetical protein